MFQQEINNFPSPPFNKEGQGGFSDETISLLLLSIIILVGAFLRIFMLGNKGFWGDEIQSTAFAQNSISIMLRYISQTEFSPPLDYLFLHFISLLGKTEFIFRLPLALSGVLTIFVVYKLGSTLFTKKEGLVSAFLLAISPFHIIYSRDARMYSLFTLFSLLSYLFFYLAAKNNKWSHWLLYAVTTSLSLYTHYFTVFIILTQIAIIFTTKNSLPFETNSKIVRFFSSLFLVFLSFIPWLPSFMRQMSISQKFTPLVPLEEIILWIIDETFRWLGTGTRTGLFLFLIFFIFGVFSSIRKFKEQTLFLLLAFFLPIPFSIILVITVEWLFQPRYILFILPFYLILAAIGISDIANRLTLLKAREILTISLLAIVILSISLIPIKNIFILEKENWRDAAAYLLKNMAYGELLIVEPSWGFWCLDHYQDLSNLRELPLINRRNHGVGVWFIRPYNARPEEKLQKIIKIPFVLKKSFPGWNTINVWFSPSEIKAISLPDLPLKDIKKLKDKIDLGKSLEWSWFATSGEKPVPKVNRSLYNSKYSFTLSSNSSLQDFILLSPPFSLSSPADSAQQGSLQNLYFSGRIKASSSDIFPEIGIHFYDQARKGISDVNLPTEAHMTGDLTYWGWISRPVKVPQRAFFIKMVFKIPSIDKKGGWVEFDDLKLYKLDSNPVNQAS